MKSLLSFVLAVACATASVTSAEPPAPPFFTDVTASAGLGAVRLVSGSGAMDYIVETTGTGVAAFDYDNDGWQDLYFVNGSRLDGFPKGAEPLAYLFHNSGDGTFADASRGSGLAEHHFGSGVAAGDFDNDGFTDLYVTAYGPNRLYHNRGDGTFEEKGREAGVDDRRYGASAAFFDYDNDGLLDLYVTNYVAFDTKTVARRGDPEHPCIYRGAMVVCGPTGLKSDLHILYHNNGDSTFEDVTVKAGIRSDIGMYGLGVAAADYDDDGDVDLYVANDATPNQLYVNRGDGSFDEQAALAGVAYGTDGIEAGSMGTAWGDMDGDGLLDIVVTNFSHQFFQVFRSLGGSSFDDVSYPSGVAEVTFLSLGWATEFVDFDLDGDLDLYFVNGHVYPGVDAMHIGTSFRQGNLLLRSDRAEPGKGAAGVRFTDISASAGKAFSTPRCHRAGGAFDFDRDGDLDLVLTVIDETALLLRNDVGSSKGQGASFRVVGTRANRSGVGAKLTATVSGRRLVRHAMGGGSYLWGHDERVHFGFPLGSKIDRLEVVWPSGTKQEFKNLAAAGEFVIVEGRDIAKEERAPVSKADR